MDNPFFIFTILGFELLLVYLLFFRRYSWYYLLTPSGFFLSLFLAIITVPGCVNYYLWDWRYTYSSTDSYLVVILFTPAIFIFTSLFAEKRFGILIRRVETYRKSNSGSHRFYMFCTCVCAMVVLVKLFPQSALFQLLKSPNDFGNIKSIDSMRHNFDIFISGNYIAYVMLLLNKFLSPIAIFLGYLDFIRKRTILSLVVLVSVSALLGLVTLLSLHKSPIVFLLLPIVFFIVINALKQKKIAKIVLLCIFVLILTNFMYIIHYGPNSTTVGKKMSYNKIERIAYRIFYPPTRNVLNYTEYTEQNGFRGLSVYRIFSRLAGTEYSRHANEIFFWFTNTKNEAATMNAAFIGAAYLGWGLWGIIIHSMLLQFYFTFIEIIYGKMYFNNLVLVSLIATSAVMSTLISTDAVSFMGSWGGMYALFWALGLLAFSGKSFHGLHCLTKASKAQPLS